MARQTQALKSSSFPIARELPRQLDNDLAAVFQAGDRLSNGFRYQGWPARDGASQAYCSVVVIHA